MKKLLFGLLLAGLFLVSPVESAVVEGGDIVSMSASLDATTGSRKITAISWVSAAGNEIGATHGFILTDTAGVVIASSEATALKFDYTITFPYPITVAGLIASNLDAGVLYIYGPRR